MTSACKHSGIMGFTANNTNMSIPLVLPIGQTSESFCKLAEGGGKVQGDLHRAGHPERLLHLSQSTAGTRSPRRERCASASSRSVGMASSCADKPRQHFSQWVVQGTRMKVCRTESKEPRPSSDTRAARKAPSFSCCL